MISLIFTFLPSVNAYSVSQYVHLKGQPAVLIKTVGLPEFLASPWIEWKISLIDTLSSSFILNNHYLPSTSILFIFLSASCDNDVFG